MKTLQEKKIEKLEEALKIYSAMDFGCMCNECVKSRKVLTELTSELSSLDKEIAEQGEQRKSAEGMINKIYNKIADDLKSARLEGWNTSDGDKYPLKDYLSQHGTIQTGIDEINNIVEQIEIEPLLKQYAEQYHRDKLREELVKVCKEIEIYIQTNKSYKSCIGMGYFAERFDEYLKDK